MINPFHYKVAKQLRAPEALIQSPLTIGCQTESHIRSTWTRPFRQTTAKDKPFSRKSCLFGRSDRDCGQEAASASDGS